MAKHDDKDKEKDESQQQGNGRVSPDIVISPRDPGGKHSAPEDDEDNE